MADPTPESLTTTSVLGGVSETTQVDGSSRVKPAIPLIDRNGQRVAPVAQTPVSLNSPPATLTQGTSTELTWNTTSNETSAGGTGWAVRRFLVQNNTTVNVHIEWETAVGAASLGSFLVAPGTTWSFDVPCMNLWVWPEGGSAINLGGTSAGNLIIKGWL